MLVPCPRRSSLYVNHPYNTFMGLPGRRILTIIGTSRDLSIILCCFQYMYVYALLREKQCREACMCAFPRNLCMASIREQRARGWSTRFFTRGKIDGFENGFSEPFTEISKVLLDVSLTHTNMGYVCLMSMWLPSSFLTLDHPFH